jgi:hypothetical protein
MNTLPEDVIIRKGQKYGTFTRICTLQEVNKTPWRICAIGPSGQTATSESPGGAKSAEFKQGRRGKDSKQRREWLKTEFRLLESPCLLTNQDVEDALDLLMDYWDTFSHDGEYGETTLIQHEIHTEEGPPIKTKNRPLNPSLEPDLRAQIETWTKHGVIEPALSPWSFALVAAPKKGGKIRWCVDYRRLNAITKKDSFPLPNMEDNLARLSRSKIFSGIDGCGAFHVVPLAKEHRPKTAFNTPWGSYQFARMPFGLTNAPATYCRLVQMVLDGIPHEMALPYLDDTCVHSRDLLGHFKALRRVLQAHRQAGLKLQPSKCALFQKEIEYLGHVVTGEGIHPTQKYIKVVQDWPMPRTKSEARTFLGKVGYYRRFIQDYSAVAAPWTSVTGKEDKLAEKTPLVLTEKMRASFEMLRKCLTTAPILAYSSSTRMSLSCWTRIGARTTRR